MNERQKDIEAKVDKLIARTSSSGILVYLKLFIRSKNVTYIYFLHFFTIQTLPFHRLIVPRQRPRQYLQVRCH
jgi:hypothetical protein